MEGSKIGAIVLIVAGTLGLVYGQFSYNKSTDKTTVGPVSISVTDRQTVNVPAWAGVAAIVAGSLILVAGKRGSRA